MSFNDRLARCLAAEALGGPGAVAGKGSVRGAQVASLVELVFSRRPDMSQAEPAEIVQEFAGASLIERARRGCAEDRSACRSYLLSLHGFEPGVLDSEGVDVEALDMAWIQHYYAAKRIAGGDSVARAKAAVVFLSGRPGVLESIFDQPLNALEGIIEALEEADGIGQACPAAPELAKERSSRL